MGDWEVEPVESITIPTDAQTGESRIVIGQDIPAELVAKYGASTVPGGMVGCVIYYSVLDTCYTYQGLLNNIGLAFAYMVTGVVNGGVVYEQSRNWLNTVPFPDIPVVSFGSDPTLTNLSVQIGDPATLCQSGLAVYGANGMWLGCPDPDVMLAPWNIDNISQPRGCLNQVWWDDGNAADSVAAALAYFGFAWSSGNNVFKYRPGRVYRLHWKFGTYHNGPANGNGLIEVTLRERWNVAGAQVLRTVRVPNPSSFPASYEFDVYVKNMTPNAISYCPGMSCKGIYGGTAPTHHYIYGDGSVALCEVKQYDEGSIIDPVAMDPECVTLNP